MTLDDDQRAAFREAAAGLNGVDEAVYEAFGRDPLQPVIGLGPADAPVGFFGRDPGREEIRHGMPFIGGGGQMLRRALYAHHHGTEMPGFDASVEVGRGYFWANTVPYKPVGNKAWSMAAKRRFHPLMRSVLVHGWRGRELITLGREAFLWFGIDRPRGERRSLEAFWQRPDRFEASFTVTLTAPDGTDALVRLHPLPHPSPLNATWYRHFPGLLHARLATLPAPRTPDTRPV
ncbi:hypothetical protein KBTX_00525 [wastewater metagenome]|uniref:Uracil-DNA glycosylase-like domain-containing protein n=2 Tax=unclassified sequences TaxID=12908 RepID=A0A5B8R6Y3_9ZZZZ|nr:uracil-DNA glycosylase family protein [Arhodomonas aquaeolei]MCS4504044.1 uracil-DNA glycosylase family protein [Arhodomonas aquaeolei]QEA04221.1 hypothetical protein KBTEX_00525 [uncultured organism]